MLLLRNIKCFSLLCNVGQSERIKFIGSENDTGETMLWIGVQGKSHTSVVLDMRLFLNCVIHSYTRSISI
jgi:hypothetical protein